MTKTKKILIILLSLLFLVILFNFDLLMYGWAQAKGQLEIIHNARPNREVLADSAFPDSLKSNLRIVDAIKSFAFDSLGLNKSDNYSKVYDQKGKEIMFVVTACEPFQLEPKKWKFPLIGEFSYKGFFDESKANALAQKLSKEGYDTNVRTAGGWSTLGWFQDPILSNMLDDDESGFAELLIHELTHGTLFVKDSIRFNENLATFIGIKGTEKYLIAKYGPDNMILKEYQQRWSDRNRLSQHILRGAKKLDSLYHTFGDEMLYKTKITLKENTIRKIMQTVDTLDLYDTEKYIRYYRDLNPNNTFFMSYLRYRGDFSSLSNELTTKYDGNLRLMLQAYKSRYPSL